VWRVVDRVRGHGGHMGEVRRRGRGRGRVHREDGRQDRGSGSYGASSHAVCSFGADVPFGTFRPTSVLLH
jgi:hypothetical protein